MEARVAVLEQIAKSTEQLLAKMDARLDRMDTRFDRMDARLDRMDARLDRIEDRQRTDFKWLLGLGIGATATLMAGMAGLLATMAHGFHWI